MKLYDSEIKLMEIIWANEPVSAKEVSKIAEAEIGWNKNTTYTVIKKVIDKGWRRDCWRSCFTARRRRCSRRFWRMRSFLTRRSTNCVN